MQAPLIDRRTARCNSATRRGNQTEDLSWDEAHGSDLPAVAEPNYEYNFHSGKLAKGSTSRTMTEDLRWKLSPVEHCRLERLRAQQEIMICSLYE